MQQRWLKTTATKFTNSNMKRMRIGRAQRIGKDETQMTPCIYFFNVLLGCHGVDIEMPILKLNIC